MISISVLFNIFGAFCTLILAVIGLLYIFLQIKVQYWKKKNVYYIPPKSPMGSFLDLKFQKSPGDLLKDIYEDTKRDHKYVGLYVFHKPHLLVNDPDLAKNIFVRDFAHFQDRGVYVDEEGDPLAAHLFSISGSSWRNLRVKLTPTFTSGKMKMMFKTLTKTAEQLKEFLEKPAERKEELRIKDFLERFGTDVIASCAFGIETNSLRNPDCEFMKMSKRMTKFSTPELLKLAICFTAPEIAQFFKFKQTKQDVEDFFLPVVKETVEHREKNNIQRNDFMQLLIELKNKGYVEDVDAKQEERQLEKDDMKKFTIEQLAAQAHIFFMAGFETSSTTVQYTLYELSLNVELQDKLREEIDRVLLKHDGELTYEGVQKMELLDRVISETLRKYPPLPFLTRECTKPYKIPDTDIILEKGTMIQIPIYGIQRDERYYPEPDRFDPDRFTEEEKSKRHHYVYMPFGEGPRNCIGSRFGLMETKVAVITVLSNFKFHVSERTPIPIVFVNDSTILQPKGGMYLRITKR